MTKIPNKEGSFRRWIRQLFSSLIKRQNSEIEEVLAKLQDIEESIETIAREMARRIKRGR
jgi:uncharacterized protein YaaN involved in tellurite resistance